MRKSLITEPLGLYGWTHLEPVILASLASEDPMLLIGKHGSAKSFLLERLAESLNMNFKCYNASLINYDDLVGIPVPSENNTSLNYISNPSSIWDAEVVFIDELNRTKPELQNKLFPIVYDKRVQGIKLEKLKYRWAAMNPPPSEDEEENEMYIGTVTLDPALADRFTYLIEVPSWEELDDNDKRKMLKDYHLGRHEFPIDLCSLISETKERYNELLKMNNEVYTEYIISLMKLLNNTLGYFSSRRATMFEDSLLYITAACNVLDKYGDYKSEFNEPMFLHIQNTIPLVANGNVDRMQLINICSEAINVSNLTDTIEKSVFLISDPTEKLKYLIKNKDKVGVDIVNDVITSSLSKIGNRQERRAMALFTYLTFRTNATIHASVMETVTNEIYEIFNPQKRDEYSRNKLHDKISDEIQKLMTDIPKEEKYGLLLNNYMYSYFYEYKTVNEVDKAFRFFVDTYKELEL